MYEITETGTQAGKIYQAATLRRAWLIVRILELAGLMAVIREDGNRTPIYKTDGRRKNR